MLRLSAMAANLPGYRFHALKHSDQDEPMRDAARAAKLPKATAFYTLRHTFIASAITGGMDIHTVAKITGTSVRMIEEHYGKLLQVVDYH